jgi:hypothetical protein
MADVRHEEMHVRSSSCKERKHAHPNMVLVHDQSQESSPIDLLEVGMRWSTPPPLFSWLSCVPNFLVGLVLRKKVREVEKKKSRRKSSEMGPDPSDHLHPSFDFDRIDDRCFS